MKTDQEILSELTEMDILILKHLREFDEMLIPETVQNSVNHLEDLRLVVSLGIYAQLTIDGIRFCMRNKEKFE